MCILTAIPLKGVFLQGCSQKGTHFGTASSKVDDFNAVSAFDIAGIEVYVGAAVPAFVPPTACGVILVWLKR